MKISISALPFHSAAGIREYVERRLLPLAHDYPNVRTVDVVLDHREHRGTRRFVVKARLCFDRGQTRRTLRCSQLHEGIDRTARQLFAHLRQSRQLAPV